MLNVAFLQHFRHVTKKVFNIELFWCWKLTLNIYHSRLKSDFALCVCVAVRTWSLLRTLKLWVGCCRRQISSHEVDQNVLSWVLDVNVLLRRRRQQTNTTLSCWFPLRMIAQEHSTKFVHFVLKVMIVCEPITEARTSLWNFGDVVFTRASAGLCESNVFVRPAVCHTPVLCQKEES